MGAAPELSVHHGTAEQGLLIKRSHHNRLGKPMQLPGRVGIAALERLWLLSKPTATATIRGMRSLTRPGFGDVDIIVSSHYL